MIEEQEWLELKQEFKEIAYQRVHDKGYVFSSNDEVEREFAGYGDVELKPLQELFEHGVKYHGDDEYLMWEWEDIERGIVTAHSNESVLKAIESNCHTLRRKTSASLPFDLQRAIDKLRMKYPPRIKKMRDNYCEWHYKFYWRAGCGNNEFSAGTIDSIKNFKFCPFCGKEIKQVTNHD